MFEDATGLPPFLAPFMGSGFGSVYGLRFRAPSMGSGFGPRYRAFVDRIAEKLAIGLFSPSQFRELFLKACRDNHSLDLDGRNDRNARK